MIRPILFVGPLSVAFPAKVEPDPLNTHSYEKLKPRILSVVDLRADHGVDGKRSTNVKQGKSGKFEESFSSKLLGNRRGIYYYLPPGYNPARKYPLLLLDTTYLSLIYLPQILDQMLTEGSIEPLIVVFFSHVDLAAESACDPKVGDALATELIPWLRARLQYRATRRTWR